MKKSESIKSISGAIAKAQGEIENASKNSTNPHYKSRYADLAEVLNTVRPVFSRHALAITQGIETGADRVSVTTLISHDSGEWIEGAISAPLLQQTPQGVGSVATYLRRYSLAALCGIAQEDDDGEAASRPAPQARPAPVAPPVNLADVEAELLESTTRAQVEAVKQRFAHLPEGEDRRRIREFVGAATKRLAGVAA